MPSLPLLQQALPLPLLVADPEATRSLPVHQGLEVVARRSGAAEQQSVRDLFFSCTDEEIRVLRGELRTSTQG